MACCLMGAGFLILDNEHVFWYIFLSWLQPGYRKNKARATELHQGV
jgi:hypothetical protein